MVRSKTPGDRRKRSKSAQTSRWHETQRGGREDAVELWASLISISHWEYRFESCRWGFMSSFSGEWGCRGAPEAREGRCGDREGDT